MTYVGPIADYDGRAVEGARRIGRAVAARLGTEPVIVGRPGIETDRWWQPDLAAAMPDLMELQAAHAAALETYRPFIALPRCAAALATLPNVVRAEPDALVIWLDAHADLNTPASTTTGYIGGMILSAVMGWWDSGLGSGLTPDNLILGGTRALDPFEQGLVEEGEIKCAPGASLLEELDELIGDRPVYVHLDCDLLEPGIVPTEYPVPGGLLLEDLAAVASRLSRNRVIGVEIAEFEAPAQEDEIDGEGTGLLDALAPLLGV